jgi:hypothetical protein
MKKMVVIYTGHDLKEGVLVLQQHTVDQKKENYSQSLKDKPIYKKILSISS